MTQRIGNPFPLFVDRRGRPLDGGHVYIGAAGSDPESEPLNAFFDADLTVAATQPIAVLGGVLSRDGNPALIYVAEGQFSLRVRDADGAEVFYVAAANPSTDEFQPLDTDLTAIAALSTTAFGRALLTMANGAAARSALGIADALPLAGGAVTGPITYQTAGAYPYLADPEFDRARIFVTANGAADPRSNIGDIWLEEEA